MEINVINTGKEIIELVENSLLDWQNTRGYAEENTIKRIDNFEECNIAPLVVYSSNLTGEEEVENIGSFLRKKPSVTVLFVINQGRVIRQLRVLKLLSEQNPHALIHFVQLPFQPSDLWNVFECVRKQEKKSDSINWDFDESELDW